jgi:hypothetical protein
MITPKLIQRFAQLETQISNEKGDFALFALFMREEVPDRWDLMISARWLGHDNVTAVNYLVEQIKSKLGDGALINLARIVVIDPDDAHVQELNREIHVEHGNVEVRDSTFSGLAIKQAHIITSNRPPAQAVG